MATVKLPVGTVMNGPAQFGMNVYIINDATQQAGEVTLSLGYFAYPTPESIAARIAKFEAESLVGELEGFRLMTKHEAFAARATEFYNEAVQLVAPEAWDPI